MNDTDHKSLDFEVRKILFDLLSDLPTYLLPPSYENSLFQKGIQLDFPARFTGLREGI